MFAEIEQTFTPKGTQPDIRTAALRGNYLVMEDLTSTDSASPWSMMNPTLLKMF